MYEDMTTRELIRAVKELPNLSLLELQLLDRLDAAMEEVDLLQREVSSLLEAAP